jgi:hypothetical protein
MAAQISYRLLYTIGPDNLALQGNRHTHRQ